MKALVALRGGTAMSLAREFQPGAITLDVRLPDMSGWTLLDRLKHDPRTAHIPVHIISGHENNRRGLRARRDDVHAEGGEQGIAGGDFRRDRASMERREKTLLLVAENDVRTATSRKLLAGDDLEIITRPTDLEARRAVRIPGTRGCDRARLGAARDAGNRVHRIGAGEVAAARAGRSSFPGASKLIGTAGDGDSSLRPGRAGAICAARSNGCWKRPCCCCIARRARCRRDQRRVLAEVRQTDPMLAGRKVLVIDDDLRNIFALTSVLEQHEN